MPYLEHDELRLAYQTRGDHGSPVLLVMGFGMPGSAWKLQVPDLARRHRVAWYDHRGSGDTEAPPGRYTMDLLAGDALRLLDHLGWERAHLVGVSMGGMVAQEVALRHPERLRSLALLVSHAGGRLRSRLPTGRGAARFLRANVGRREQRLAGLERLLFPDSFLRTCDRQWLRGVLEPDFSRVTSLRHRLSQLHAIRGHDTAGRLHRLEGLPVLVVKAGQDLLVRPAESDRLHRLIPGSRLVAFPEAGHGLIRQVYPRLNATLLEHFDAADRRAGASRHGWTSQPCHPWGVKV